MIWLTWMPVILTPAVAVLVAWLTTRGNQRTAEIEAEAAPYAELSKDVVALRREVRDLDREVRGLRDQLEAAEERAALVGVAITHITLLNNHILRGDPPPPPPIPARLLNPEGE